MLTQVWCSQCQILCNRDVYCIMYFLDAARILNSPVLAECKENVLYDPGLAARPPPHLHKITNEPVDYMALAPYDFAGGQRHYLGRWKGWVMKVSTFMAQPFQLPA